MRRFSFKGGCNISSEGTPIGSSILDHNNYVIFLFLQFFSKINTEGTTTKISTTKSQNKFASTRIIFKAFNIVFKSKIIYFAKAL